MSYGSFESCLSDFSDDVKSEIGIDECSADSYEDQSSLGSNTVENRSREEPSDRVNCKIDDEMTSRENNNHLTNGKSPTRDSPLSLARDTEGSPRQSANNSDSKAIGIHVIVECVPICQSRIGLDMEIRGRVEVDSFTLVPAHLRFADLLQVVLAKTGYIDDLPYARGFLQLRHWRPLPLEHVAESEVKTVSDVLCEVAPMATLYIKLYSSARLRCSRDIKDRLLRLLVTQSHHLLVSAGCPLDESLLFSLIRGNGEISEELARQFENWWAIQVAHASRPHQPPVLQSAHATHALSHAQAHVMDKVSSEAMHPALQSISSPYGAQKARMRTSFDPEFELPRLHRWFAENQHPTRLQQYVTELNALESRRGRKPLDVNNVVYWFKNARAAYKRQEYRYLNGMKTPPPDEVSISDNEENGDPYQALPPPHHPSPNHQTSNTPSQQQHPPTSQQELPQSHNSTTQHQPAQLVEDQKCNIKQEEEDSHNSSAITSHSERSLGPAAVSNLDGASPSGGDRDLQESDIDMSDDDDDCRSRESGIATDVKTWGSPSPVISPGSLSLPPYPSLPGIQPDRLPYSVMSGPLFQHSMMYMAQYMPQVPPFSSGLGSAGLPEERRKRNRTFIDPVTEVPRLEQWFALNTHPSHNLILKYTEELNRMPYRQKFPKLEPKNIQFWFKNRRAKCKRLRVSM